MYICPNFCIPTVCVCARVTAAASNRSTGVFHVDRPACENQSWVVFTSCFAILLTAFRNACERKPD